MKLTKSLFLAFAGLGLFACSNEDVADNGGIQGTGMVEVTIQSPSTRSVQGSTSGSSVIVGGNITVEVYSGDILQGSEVIERNPSDSDGKTNYTVQIYGVTSPDKVVAYCNDGKAVNDAAAISITDSRLQSEPESIPAYAEATLSESDINGEMENTSDGKVYKRYTKSLALQIPVARIELDGLKHKAHDADNTEEASCKFDELFINGVYLNNIYATKNAAAVTNTYSWNESSTVESENFPILYDIIGELGKGVSFLSADGNFPTFPQEDGKAFAYNFFAGTDKEVPELKIYFNEATAASSDKPVTSPRYAIVKSYKNESGPIEHFVPGTIYRITNVELMDKNIGPNEGGETVYGVEVTVTEATWSVTDIEAVWEEQ